MSPDRSFLSVLTGSFSSPAADNPTVVMMKAAYRHHGLNARYINCDVPSDLLGDAVRGARAMGWVGFNLSMPHKVAVIAYLERLADSAKIIGAVNCAVRTGERWVGENTDGQGFVESLRTVVDPVDRSMVLLGAGGAARAIAVEVALAGAAFITVVNRDRDRGEELAELVNGSTPATAAFAPWHESYKVPAETDIVVNATPAGMAPNTGNRPDVDMGSLLPSMVVADVIPNPAQTRFLEEARERGCTTLDGLGMLVNQGAINMRHWTGVDPDRTVMRRALEEAFESEKA